jgi:hypothetical protein
MAMVAPETGNKRAKSTSSQEHKESKFKLFEKLAGHWGKTTYEGYLEMILDCLDLREAAKTYARTNTPARIYFSSTMQRRVLRLAKKCVDAAYVPARAFYAKNNLKIKSGTVVKWAWYEGPVTTDECPHCGRVAVRVNIPDDAWQSPGHESYGCPVARGLDYLKRVLQHGEVSYRSGFTQCAKMYAVVFPQ